MDAQYKEAIEQKIVDAIAKGLEENLLTESQLPEISNFVLSHIDNITTHDQLIGFLSHLSLKWSVFKNIAVEEEGKLQKKVESKVAEDVLRLISKGQTNQAIDLAQSISNDKKP